MKGEEGETRKCANGSAAEDPHKKTLFWRETHSSTLGGFFTLAGQRKKKPSSPPSRLTLSHYYGTTRKKAINRRYGAEGLPQRLFLPA